jgi:hypothetical protein
VSASKRHWRPWEASVYAPSAGREVRGQDASSSEPYTPKYLAEKILTSRTALEGERKQVTVLFAD